MPDAIPVVAQITIGLTIRGKVICQANAHSIEEIILMLEKAKLDLYHKWAICPPPEPSPIAMPNGFDPDKLPPQNGLRAGG